MADQFLQYVVEETLDAKLTNSYFVAGGCINNTIRLDTTKGTYFLKWKAHESDLFEKEKLGLELLASNSPIRVPKIIHCGEKVGNNYLLLEWIEKGSTSQPFWENFGSSLAKQHRQGAEYYGLDYDNHIGRLPQINTPSNDWSTFFIEKRIVPQLNKAVNSKLITDQLRSQFDNLFKRLPDLFPKEPPSLLHGDLWSGNFMISEDGEACIFDPAVYYGHREMELAFTKMFGGFDAQFYSAYNEAWPLGLDLIGELNFTICIRFWSISTSLEHHTLVPFNKH